MEALILCGGKGTRLKELVARIPKPMIRVCGKPVLEYQLELLRRHGFEDVVILLSHLGDVVKAYCGDGSKWGLRISYLEEGQPLGTAGGVKELEPRLQEDFLVLYGDLMLNVDLGRLLAAHARHVAAEANCAGTLLVHPNSHPSDSDLIEADTATARITRILPRPHPEGLLYRNLVNAAVYVFTRSIFEHIAAGGASDFGKDVLPRVVADERHALYAYNSPEYVLDIGTAERLEQATRDVESGRYGRGSLSVAKPAVFLDRDGVLNDERGNVCSVADFRVLDGVAAAVKRLNEAGYYVIVISNQPVIAKGYCDRQEVLDMHKKLETELGRAGAKLDAIYFCPHHPDKGFAGENPLLKIPCECRKPGTGMLKQAQTDLNIDLCASFLVGDMTMDAVAAQAAGVRFVGVRTGRGCRDGKYDAQLTGPPVTMCDDLSAAVLYILQS
jgi:mannose-1-phosphate guanylyltransferase/phosphomannomutase